MQSGGSAKPSAAGKFGVPGLVEGGQSSVLDWSLNNGGDYFAAAASGVGFDPLSHGARPFKNSWGYNGPLYQDEDGYVFDKTNGERGGQVSPDQFETYKNQYDEYLAQYDTLSAPHYSREQQIAILDDLLRLQTGFAAAADLGSVKVQGVQEARDDDGFFASNGKMLAGAVVGTPIALGKLAIEGIYGAVHMNYANQREAIYQLSGGYFGKEAHQEYLQTQAGLRNFLAHPLNAIGNGISNWYNNAADAHNRGDDFEFGMRMADGSAMLVTSATGVAGVVRAGNRGMVSVANAADEVAPLAAAADSAAAAEALAARRAYLDAKFGRSGDLQRDINYRGVVEQIEINAGLSADFAVGTPRTYGRFGTKAHGEFERLNDMTNQKIVGTDYSIITEQFRGPSIGGGPGLITSRRATGSMGIDALLEYRGTPEIGFDLKTGRGWSASTLMDLQLRFGIPIRQIYTP